MEHFTIAVVGCDCVVFILKCHFSVVLQRRVNRPPFMASQIMKATLGGRYAFAEGLIDLAWLFLLFI